SSRSNDVTLLTVCVVQQGNTCCTVWIILDRSYCSRDIFFVALEIYHSVHFFVSPTEVAHSHFTGLVTTTCLFVNANYQRFFRYVCSHIRIVCTFSKTCSRGYRFESFNCHLLLSNTVKVNSLSIFNCND